MTSTKCEGKLLLRRPPGNTSSICITYPEHQATRMRQITASIQFDGRSVPLALLAKRSITIYMDALEGARVNDPARYAEEMVSLRKMLTVKPQPALVKHRKTPLPS